MTDKSNIDQSEKIEQDESYADNSRPRYQPRTVVLPKDDDSLDFTFKHLLSQSHDQSGTLDSSLNGDETDAPDTVQLQSVQTATCSSQPMETIFVKQVRQDSKAHDAGLRTGDRIVSINGVNVAGKTYAQVIRLIHGSSDSALTLMVIPKDEDLPSAARRTESGDVRGLEIPSRGTSMMSTCVVSLSPASARREERFNHDQISFSSLPEKAQGQHPAEGISSSSPSLRICVRINAPSNVRGTGVGGSEVIQHAAFSGREQPGEQRISGGSSFYPVTTVARKIKSDDRFSPPERRQIGIDISYPSEQCESLRAAEHGRGSRNVYSGQDERVFLPPADRERQQSAFTYSLQPRQAGVDDSRRQSPKLTSYQEITLAKLSDVPGAASASFASSTVPPRASSQETYCSSSHFIQMGAVSPGPSSLLLDSQSPQRSGVSPVVGPRHQVFVSARPQSYESLFGHNRLSQIPDADPALTNATSRSSSELVESSFSKTMQPTAYTPQPSTAADQQRINLVTERMKRFESVDGSEGVRHLRALKPWATESVPGKGNPQFGFDSVAKRAAIFEQISTEDTRRPAGDTPGSQGRRNEPATKTYRVGGTGEPRELWSASTSPLSSNSKQVPQSVTIPLYFRADLSSSSNVRLATSPGLRRHEAAAQNAVDGFAAESLVSSDARSTETRTVSHSSDSQPSPKLPSRQLSSSHQEKSEKATDGSCSVTVESFSQSTTLAMAATLGIREQLFAGDAVDSAGTSAIVNASGKSGNSNIKKFVAFFTDKSPKITDSSMDKKSSSEPPTTSGNIAYEGCLVCKAAVAEGKKASDRSWKPFWAVLKSHFLCLYKDRYSMTSEDQSICIRSCMVEEAVDYIKKRNVFQITTASGSKFLFQAEDQDSMSDWVKAIQTNSELKEANEMDPATAATLSQSVCQNVPLEKTSPQVALKAKKQPSRTIPSSKSPASPLSKSRKSGVSDKDVVELPKKTWKGRMVSRFVRNRSGSGTAVELPDDQEVTGTFGVPLCVCPSSLFNENVPLIVETCTRIVEERGIENQGIYRVPGNNCAVNALRDELNKFPENIDADSEKLQDVNVVSSLLKLFFRKLPDSLITDELYESVIAAYRLQNPEKKMLKLKKLLHELPEHNFETFRFLAQHLNRVASREEVNKMDARNLAIVFGPTLVRPQDESVVLMVKDMSDQCRVVETIIINVDWFFGSWDEDVNVPVAEENEPISSVNPELLAKAENRINAAELGRDTSAKDLVSIIFNPKKKNRRKDRHKTESIETEGESDVSFTDRTVDQDLDIQGIKRMLESGTSVELASVTVSSVSTSVSMNTSVTSEAVETVKQKETLAVDKDAAGSTTTSVATSAVEVKRYPAYQFGPVIPSTETENSKPKILRRYSEDAFGLGTTHADPGNIALRPFVRDGSLVEQAQQQLKRLHLDTKALHHKQEIERVEREKRAVAKERIEKEFNKTLHELELEENDSDELSPGTGISGGNSSSVRSAMDRCKLTMYENRLRFFTDFGEKKTFSPVFRQGDVTQSSFSSTTSTVPLTRRLSDQPNDLLRAEDNCLLRAAPIRAHSVSPSIIGREPRYNFDKTDKISEMTGSIHDSSSFQKVDRSLAVVSETRPIADVVGFQSHAVNQPLIFSPGKTSASSLTASFGTESSTARSSLASSGDQSAKDSVFSEKSPTESEPVLPTSADSGFIPEIMNSYSRHGRESATTLMNVILGSHHEATALSASEGSRINGLQEKVALDSGDCLSNKEAVSSPSFSNESRSNAVLDVFHAIPQSSGAGKMSVDVSEVDSVGSLQESAAISADSKPTETKLSLANLVRNSHLVNSLDKSQIGHAVDDSHDERTTRDVVRVVGNAVNENLDLSTDTNLVDKRKDRLHGADFTETTTVSMDVASSDNLMNCSFPAESENSLAVRQEVTVDNDSSDKTLTDIVLNGCPSDPPRELRDDTIQSCKLVSPPVPSCSHGDTVAQCSNTLLPSALVKSGASSQIKSVAKFSSNAHPSEFCSTITHTSISVAKKLKRRHSVGSIPLQDFLPEPARSCPVNRNFRQFESHDLLKLRSTASLPLLPDP